MSTSLSLYFSLRPTMRWQVFLTGFPWSSRWISTARDWPTLQFFSIDLKVVVSPTFRPSMVVISSPARMPALSAGPFSATSCTTRLFLLGAFRTAKPIHGLPAICLKRAAGVRNQMRIPETKQRDSQREQRIIFSGCPYHVWGNLLCQEPTRRRWPVDTHPNQGGKHQNRPPPCPQGFTQCFVW